ncbi:potassium voltage-gated channel subfamily A member 2 isoform X2 [Hydra vulgaris]|uniref:Potassium voltage-gated channel subfamily A member 2 isoform X2 n=1 Tax=Hydra vulgaris TaxID=6087 RepID=A0ABM4BLI2_HYDVU
MKFANSKDELIYINVSGQLFITTPQVLNNFPNSLLGNKKKRDQIQKINGELYFNRHPKVFESILNFYRYGILEQPSQVNQLIFVNDIRFYGLFDEALEVGTKGLHFREKYLSSCKTDNNRRKAHNQKNWQTYIWNVLECTDSSLFAQTFSFFSLFVIILSTVVFCMETMPIYKGNELSNENIIMKNTLLYLERFCIAFFTAESITRFFTSPNKLSFIKNISNIIDIISILPFYITLILNDNETVSAYVLRTLRLTRVFRIFKLSRYSSEMTVLGITIKESFLELRVFLLFIFVGVLIFSSAVYIAEDGDPETHFSSIPDAFWWSIVTLTTVGYGDVYPKSQTGKLVGAFCAITSILVVAIPVPIIVNNFTQNYQFLKPVSKYWEILQQKKSMNFEGFSRDISLNISQDKG